MVSSGITIGSGQTIYQLSVFLQIVTAWNESIDILQLASQLCQATDSLVAARPFEAEASAAIPEATEPA